MMNVSTLANCVGSILRYERLRPPRVWAHLATSLVLGTEHYFSLHDPHFPMLDWEKVAEAQATCVHLRPGGGDGANDVLENACMASLMAWTKPKVILEIGTFRGGTTRVIYLNAPADTLIYTMDLPPQHVPHPETTDRGYAEYGVALAETRAQRPYLPQDERVRMVYGDSTEMDWASVLEGRQADVVFIDGSHSAYHAERDTRKAFEVLAPNGSIVWHDAKFRGIGYYTERYRVHDAIRKVLSPEQLQHVYRMRRTSFAVYSPTLRELFQPFLPQGHR